MDMKILLYNIAYCTGLSGSLSDYAFKWHRHLHNPREQKMQCIQDIYSTIEEEKPDVCCFVEISRDSALVEKLSKNYPHANISNKYSEKSILSKMPVMRMKGNGVVSSIPFT